MTPFFFFPFFSFFFLTLQDLSWLANKTIGGKKKERKKKKSTQSPMG